MTKRKTIANPIIDSYGAKRWYKKGKLHRVNGPAVEWPNGNKWWYGNGELHRVNGAAIELGDGTKVWYVRGTQHRLDGPARELASGVKEWWVNGERHRIDNPAVEWPNGVKWWYENGELHRIDGPAVEWPESPTWSYMGREATRFPWVLDALLRIAPEMLVGDGLVDKISTISQEENDAWAYVALKNLLYNLKVVDYPLIFALCLDKRPEAKHLGMRLMKCLKEPDRC